MLQMMLFTVYAPHGCAHAFSFDAPGAQRADVSPAAITVQRHPPDPGLQQRQVACTAAGEQTDPYRPQRQTMTFPQGASAQFL